MIYGDFNAGIHHIFDEDRPRIGSHILGRGLKFLNQTSDDTIVNRVFFGVRQIQQFFRYEHALFEGAGSALHLLGGFQHDSRPPWNALRHAQLDYALVSARWKNIVHNVECIPSIQIDSDHFVLKSEILIKLKTDPRKQRPLRPKFRPFTPEQVSMFHQYQQVVLQNGSRILPRNYIFVPNTVLRLFQRIKKSYISQETWDLIQLKHHYRKTHQKQTEVELRRRISSQTSPKR